MKNEKITGFIGLTHLGAVTSVCWASKFGNIIGVDLDEELVNLLKSNKSPFKEPGLQELIDTNKEKMIFSKDFSKLSDCDSIFITHDIVTDEENRSDYDNFYELIDEAIPHLPQNVVIILMSQISVGMTRKIKEYIKNKRKNLNFNLVYFVDTLIIGRAIDRVINPERIIVGTEDGTEEIINKYPILKKQLESFDAPVLYMRYESAEMTKICINLYLFNSVIYANIVADLSESYQADMNEIIKALRLDKRIGKYSYIQPSLGVTGGHLERDMRTIEKMQKEVGIKTDWIEKLIDINERRYRWVEKKLKDHLFSKVKNPKICIWGLAYKKDTESLKNSIAPKIINDLPNNVSYSAYDPLVKSFELSKKIELHQDRYNAVKGASCLIILTDPDEFKELDVNKIKESMNNPLILDCVNIYSDIKNEMFDVKYIAIGRAKNINK
jgi:UDPglucose 6-dehydrogenase